MAEAAAGIVKAGSVHSSSSGAAGACCSDLVKTSYYDDLVMSSPEAP